MSSLNIMHRLSFVAVLAATALGLVAGTAHAETIYGVTDTFNLVSFDSTTPGTTNTIGGITGLTAGHTLRGIDFRASDGQLYALSTSGLTAAQLYTVNLSTGALTTYGGALNLQGNTSTFLSIDFNPVPDALRIVSGGGQNYRITGLSTTATPSPVVNVDGAINPAANSFISGVAYSNSVAGATSTTMYAYDFNNNVLGNFANPNSGTFNPVGSSGIVASNAGAFGFDISGVSGLAYVNATAASGLSSLYTVNLGTGAFTSAGTFNTGMLDISVRTSVVPEPATFALMLPAVALGAVVIRRRRKA